MQNSRTKNTLINTSVAFIARLVYMFFGFVQKTIFIRTLGMSYTGVSGLFTDILTVLSLAELGIGSAISYSLFKPIADSDNKRIAQLMNFYKTAYRIIALSVLLVGLSITPLLNFIVKDVPDITESIYVIYILYVINSASTYLLVYKNTLLIAAQKQYVVSTIQAVFTVVTSCIQCVVLLLYKNFLVFLILQIVFSMLQNLTINIIATRHYPELKKYRNERLPSEDKAKLFQNIRALLLYKISSVILTGTDSTIISSSLGTANVGVIGNYRTIRGYVTSIIAQFYNSVNPSLGNLVATESKEKQYVVFKQLLFGTFWITCFCSTSFFVLFNPFIRIWLGDEKWILPLYTVGVYVFEFYTTTLNHTVGAFRIANGLFVQTKYIALIKAIINLLISIVLVRYLGILGVLIGTVVSEWATSVWYEPLVLYKEVFHKNVLNYYFLYIKYLIITISIIYITNTISMAFISNNIIICLVFRICICAIIPNTMIVILYRKTNEYIACLELGKRVIKKIKK